MQNVTEAYKTSMKQPLRGRSYIEVTFGIVNKEAQRNSTVDESESDEFTYYSKTNSVFRNEPKKFEYATLEENFTRVDGSQIFLPREDTILTYDTGVVGNVLVSDSPTVIVIKTNRPPVDFKGITIDFGGNYPTNFSITTNTGETSNFTDENIVNKKFVTQEVFENVTSITIKVNSLKNPHGRVRIISFTFGYGLSYGNDMVINSKLKSYVSPVCADVPQIDFSVQLNNRDKYFNIDNPDSAINFLEIGQEMDVSYGYELNDGNIEWIKGQHLYCNSWSTDDTTATITSQDIFRSMTSEYYLGTYESNGISMYDLAERVLNFAGIDNYYLDDSMKEIITNNPIPRVPVKQALQIIANACRCILTQDRDGKVIIQNSTDTTPSSNDFKIERMDMMSSPKAIRNELVLEVVVPIYTYSLNENTELERLTEVEIDVTNGENQMFFFDAASYGYTASLEGVENGVAIIDQSSYYVALKFKTTGRYKLYINGRRYRVSERNVINALNNRGTTVKWKNPLISEMDNALQVADWIGDYYSSNVEYQYKTRGNPEIDANDIFYQENDYDDNLKVRIYEETLNFAQSFSGEVKTRKVGS